MTRELVFSVAMQPIGKGRHRSSVVNGRVHTYPDAATVLAEAEIRNAFRRAYPRFVTHDGPAQLYVVATFVPPKSWAKWQRAAAIAGAWRHTTKPDADNVGKLVADALNGRAYSDDAHLCFTCVEELYGDTARLLVRMRLLEQPTRADFEAAR